MDPRRMHRCCCMFMHVRSRVDAICDENPVLRFITTVYCDYTEIAPEHRTLRRKVALIATRIILNFLSSTLSLFLLWLIFFRPYKVRPYVDAAVLAGFASTSDAAGNGMGLRYDLALNVTFFNDNHIYRVRFDHLTAWLHYNGTKLGASDDTLPGFNLGPRRRRTVYPTLRGRAGGLGAAVVEELSRQQGRGRLSIDVRVKTTLTYMFWPVRATYYYEYDCWLQFPAPVNSDHPAVTDTIKCQHVAK